MTPEEQLNGFMKEAYARGFNNAKNGALMCVHSVINLPSTDNRTRAALEELHKIISTFEAL